MTLPLQPDQVLDAKGLSCPGPIIALRKALKTVQVGQILEVQATDPASMPDFKAWAEETGHSLLAAEKTNGIYVYLIRKEEV
jgi:tRNA 2-thiouridine synthesizing protein A